MLFETRFKQLFKFYILLGLGFTARLVLRVLVPFVMPRKDHEMVIFSYIAGIQTGPQCRQKEGPIFSVSVVVWIYIAM